MLLFGFILFLVLFMLIGLAAMKKAASTVDDYLLAGRTMPEWLASLSAVATNNSGYMFIGIIGYTYKQGLAAVWLMFGWIVGDLLISYVTHNRMQKRAEAAGAESYLGILTEWQGKEYVILRRVLGVIALVFMGSYAAAQLSAGGKATTAIFKWPAEIGICIGMVLVLLYSFSGGIRASIWTDAAQSMVMILSMGAIFGGAVYSAGGVGAFVDLLSGMKTKQSDYLSWFPGNLELGLPLGALIMVGGWLAGGIGVTGQPHIMVRFLTLKKDASYLKIRLYYYSWFTVFYSLAILSGMAARTLLDPAQMSDPEMALPLMSLELLPDFWVGVMLAGIFAATMSTADSLILSCSASLSRDFFPGRRDNLWFNRISTLLVVLFALSIALWGSDSVFDLVMDSWSVMGAAFGPMLILLSLNRRISEVTGITMAVGALIAVYAWKYLVGGYVYEIVPGMVTGFLFYLLGSKFFKPAD